MNINIDKIENEKNIVAVELDGRLDAQHSDKVEENLIQLIDEGHVNFIIDMQNIVYLGSSGIRVLLSLNNKLSTNNPWGILCEYIPKHYFMQYFFY